MLKEKKKYKCRHWEKHDDSRCSRNGLNIVELLRNSGKSGNIFLSVSKYFCHMACRWAEPQIMRFSIFSLLLMVLFLASVSPTEASEINFHRFFPTPLQKHSSHASSHFFKRNIFKMNTDECTKIACHKSTRNGGVVPSAELYVGSYVKIHSLFKGWWGKAKPLLF